MKKQAKVQIFTLLKGFLLAVTLLSGTPGFAHPPAVIPLSCIIEGLQRTAVTQSSISYSWNAVYGATGYKAFYIRLTDNYVSQVESVSGTSITFSGLQSGAHHFYFAAVCSGETLQYIEDEWIIL